MCKIWGYLASLGFDNMKLYKPVQSWACVQVVGECGVGLMGGMGCLSAVV